MKAEYINPFIKSVMNVMSTMAGLQPIPQKPLLKKDSRANGVVTGLIGMAGPDVSGNMLVSFEESTILYVVSKMLMEEVGSLDEDLLDAVGELTNMISGGAKANLAELGLSFDMATPVMVKGEAVELHQLSKSPVISIPFQTEHGMFWIEANLSDE